MIGNNATTSSVPSPFSNRYDSNTQKGLLRLANALNNIGAIHYNRGEPCAALDYYREAVRVRKMASFEADLDSDRKETFDETIGTCFTDVSINSRILETECYLVSLRREKKHSSCPRKFVQCDIGIECFMDTAVLIDSLSNEEYSAELAFHPEPVRIFLQLTSYDDEDDDRNFKILAYNMGLVRLCMGNLDLAIQLFQMSISTKPKNNYVPTVAIVGLHHIGRILYLEKRYDAAVDAFSMALTRGRFHADNNLSDEHGVGSLSYYRRFIASTLVCIAVTYLKKDQIDTAKSYCQEALLLRKTLLGDDHWHAAIPFHIIGQIHDKKGESSEACKHYELFLQLATAKLGKNHPHVADTLRRIGDILYKDGKLSEAQEFYLKSLQVANTVFGDLHVNVSRILYCIGRVLHEKEDYADALEIYERTLKIQQLTLGSYHVEAVATMCNIGRVYHVEGNLNAALTAHRKTFEIASIVVGYLHPLVAFTLKTIGNICLEMGEIDAALDFLAEARRINKVLQLDDDDDDDTTAALLLRTNRRQPDAAAA